MYRQERNSYENLNKRIFDGVGMYNAPIIAPEHISGDVSFVGFNYARSCKRPEDKALHFFVDDYQFSRLWANPDAYLDMLRRFKFVCTPDFSLYTDFPLSVQIFNHFRKHWLGAYWQENGITVIPTMEWSDERSYSWCFDGEPIGGTVAVSSIGTQAKDNTRRLFLQGYNEMLKRVKPDLIYFYGIVPNECEGNIIRIPAFQEQLKERTRRTK